MLNMVALGQSMGVTKLGSQKIGGCWALPPRFGGVADPLIYAPSSTCYFAQIYSKSDSGAT